MNRSFKQLCKSEKGFTLVELAIVMIIIGLLITGILKGQEMIANAQVTSTVSQIKGIDAALSTFRDKYRTLPGDMTAPNTRLPGCAAAPCSTVGNGNGRIDVPALGAVPTLAQEGTTAWAHMAAANLLSGVQINGVAADVDFGRLLPSANIGGGYFIGYTAATAATAPLAANTLRPGHYLVLNGQNITAAAGTGILDTSQALQIDTKLDDGLPATGSVQSDGTSCTLAGPPISYDTANGAGLCVMFIRVQS